eukprot:TRINITY_DN15282_c0_g1_i1.p1 TRINITY_DN15282_c0_g1~~TRINITY_DN15282_c0_g1_i1.p1  ORF type:complete len:396 (+),score=28.62 TRINITY_DN15282_c0_g1_i1:39-1226(+)
MEELIPTESRIVDQDQLSELQCFVCLQLLESPHQCANGHLVCKGCIPTCRKNDHFICPQCGILSNPSKNVFVQNHIQNLKVYCTNRFQTADGKPSLNHSDGCQEILSLNDQLLHHKDCIFSLVKCPNRRCNTKMRKKDFLAHKTHCTYRNETCADCSAPYQICDKERHLGSCIEVIVQCKCGCKIKRKDLSSHAQICPEEFIDCSRSFFGCPCKVKRRFWNDHIKEHASEHLQMLKQQFENTLLELQRRYDYEIQSRDLSNQRLKSRVKRELKAIWPIKNFSSQIKKGELKSEEFENDGIVWQIKMSLVEDELFFGVIIKNIRGKQIECERSFKIGNTVSPLESVVIRNESMQPHFVLPFHFLENKGLLYQDSLIVKAKIYVKKIIHNCQTHSIK